MFTSIPGNPFSNPNVNFHPQMGYHNPAQQGHINMMQSYGHHTNYGQHIGHSVPNLSASMRFPQDSTRHILSKPTPTVEKAGKIDKSEVQAVMTASTVSAVSENSSKAHQATVSALSTVSDVSTKAIPLSESCRSDGSLHLLNEEVGVHPYVRQDHASEMMTVTLSVCQALSEGNTESHMTHTVVPGPLQCLEEKEKEENEGEPSKQPAVADINLNKSFMFTVVPEPEQCLTATETPIFTKGALLDNPTVQDILKASPTGKPCIIETIQRIQYVLTPVEGDFTLTHVEKPIEIREVKEKDQRPDVPKPKAAKLDKPSAAPKPTMPQIVEAPRVQYAGESQPSRPHFNSATSQLRPGASMQMRAGSSVHMRPGASSQMRPGSSIHARPGGPVPNGLVQGPPQGFGYGVRY